MTKETYLQVPEAFYQSVFKWLWIAAAVAAVIFGTCAQIWPNYAVPLLAVPLAAAALGGAAIGWIGAGGPAQETTRQFTSNFWLRLNAKDPGVGTDVFEALVPVDADREKVHLLKAQTGEFFLINSDRFVELLVSRTKEDAGKATEHALGLAYQRCCGELRPDLAPLLSKTFRELFTQDLNGSLVAMLSKVGDQLIEELRAEASPTPENVLPFELVPLTPDKGPKQKALTRKRAKP